MDGPTQIGPYRILGELGRGGMGVVYRALRPDLNREFALKVVAPGAGGSDPGEAVARLRREAQAAAGLAGHPGIVAVHDIGEADDRIYVAMDVIEGGALHDLIEQGELTPARAAALVAQAARAVAFAHSRGILHRDLKPANVLLGADGHARIADFGLALSRQAGADVSRLTKSGAIIGTPAYMPPEQARGEGLDVRADVYSLGATLYEAIVGVPPFTGDSIYQVMGRVLKGDPPAPRSRRPGIPRDLDTIVLKCLAKAPAERYPNATALAEDLERFERGEAIAARPSGSFDRVVRRVRRNPTAWLGGAVAACAVLALAMVLGFRAWQVRAALAADLATAEALTPTDPEAALGILGRLEARAPGLAGVAAARSRAEARRGAMARERLQLQAQGLLDTGLAASRAHAAALARSQALFHERAAAGWGGASAEPRSAEAQAAAEAARTELEARARELDETWAATQSALGAVLVILAASPELPEAVAARGALAAAARARAADAELRGDARQRTRFLEILERHAGPDDAAFLAGDGRLTLDSDPSGARVECFRFVDRGGRLEPEPFRDLGTTPLRAVPLPMGSYWLVLRHPDRPELGYPVCIERQEDEVTPRPVLLPAAHRIPAGFRYVPGGQTMLGGDFAAPGAGPLRREWVDGVCVSEFEVTSGEYAEFIQAQVAAARADGTLTQAELSALQLKVPRQWRWANFFWRWAGDRFTGVGSPTHPVFGIALPDAEAYCAWRSRRDGRPYRLPSEAEWERAARGADGRAFPWGNGFDPTWFFGVGHPAQSADKKARPAPVGTATPDVGVFGVRDLAGSVSEYCWSTPAGPPHGGAERGGCWYTAVPSGIHAARREPQGGLDVSMGRGFRLVTPLGPE